jgi:hypothetical protein
MRRGMPGLPRIRRSSQPLASRTPEAGKPQKASVDLFSTIDTWRAGRRLGWREWSVLAFMGVWAFWVFFVGERETSLANKCSLFFILTLVMGIAYLVSAVAKK